MASANGGICCSSRGKEGGQAIGNLKRSQADGNYLEWILKTFSEFAFTRGAEKWCPPARNNVHDLLFGLKSCSRKRDLQEGRRIHRNAVEVGNDLNIFVAAAIINMYAKCSCMADAQRVFDSIKRPDLVSWTALILGYAENGKGQFALDFFFRMKNVGACTPDSVIYAAAIKACTSLATKGDEGGKEKCLQWGKKIHSEIGCYMNHLVQNALINMYSKCGSMIHARGVFDSIQDPDTVSWTGLILGYADNGEGQAALDVFFRMKVAGKCTPDSVTYIAAIKACTALVADGYGIGKAECLKWGKEIHLKIGHCMDRFVANTLISMYAKCSSMLDARRVFDSVLNPDVVLWNALIQGYAENGEECAALELFSRMKAVRGRAPNSVTYLAAIKACTSLAVHGDSSRKGEYLERGREIHLGIGCHLSHFVQCTLVDMYSKCGSMVEAQRVFESNQKRDVVSWNTLILGYAENGEGHAALELFYRMKAEHECTPNCVTYLAAIKACTSLAVHGDGSKKRECLEKGREIHLEIGHHMDHFLQSTLIDMYAKCGSMADACRVFDCISEPNVVSWTSLILGYADNGEGQVALDFFSRMKSSERCAPDSMTHVAALKACGSIGALATGRKLHLEITDFDVHVVTCLVDFYAKCGSMVEAQEVFDSHSRTRNITMWNALLAGYGSFGDFCVVFKLFETMQDQGFRPNAVTFVCILTCCSHAGLVEKARIYFQAMPLQYDVTPTMMHYSCMIDVLGRANQLDEAVALLQKMPCKPIAVAWMALLSVCRKWKNIEVGRLAFQSLVDLDEKNEAAYIVMSQIYGSRGMWFEQEKLLETRRNYGA